MIFNMVGGGAALNFKIVGGTAQPVNPAENTIWVDTDAKITSWIFSAAEPAPEEGMVWIRVGSASPVAFNALKNNGIMIYPVSAMQYVGGEWVAKDALIYQNGTWNIWIMYLFQNGDQNEAVTGGWSNSISDFDADNWDRGPAIGPTASSISIGTAMALKVLHSSNVNYAEAVAVGTRNKISLTGRSKIKAVCNLVQESGSSGATARLAVHTALVTPYNDPSITITAYADIPDGQSEVELDVSNISGDFHIIVGGHSGSVGYNLTVSEVRIE